MNILETGIFIEGVPAPQGSKRHVGNGVMVEASKKVKPWRKAVNDTVEKLSITTFKTALEVFTIFYLPKPPSVRRLLPTVPPDLDKLERGLFDALTIAGVWEDDALVIKSTSMKVYAEGGQPTGAFVIVNELDSPPAELQEKYLWR